jgi:preprotein translocase subunit YajC
MQFHFILCQAAASGSTSMYTNILFIGGMFAVMYFFMIRPQQKKAKDQKKFMSEIGVGDKVITIGGLHGKIVEMTDLTITLEVDQRGNKMVFERAAISLDSTKRLKAPETASTSK